MWPSIRRWLDWHRPDRSQCMALRAGLRSFRWSYEHSGLVAPADAIPWVAEAVRLEITLAGSDLLACRRTDFTLRGTSETPLPCQDIQRVQPGLYRLEFRFPLPAVWPSAVQFCWRDYALLNLTLPRLTQEEYLRSVRWRSWGVAMRWRQKAVTARCFSRRSLRGLAAAVLISSPHRLLPLASLQPHLFVQGLPNGPHFELPLILTASQQLDTEALLTVPFPQALLQSQQCHWQWRTTGCSWHAETLTILPPQEWEHQVLLRDACFYLNTNRGWVRHTEASLPHESGLFAPCFLLQAPPGSAGLLPLTFYALTSQAPRLRRLRHECVLVTDAPTPYIPGLFHFQDFPQLTSLELRHGPRILSTLSLSRIPQARFTAEGGFRQAPDVIWTESAEAELWERLQRLSRHGPDSKRPGS